MNSKTRAKTIGLIYLLLGLVVFTTIYSIKKSSDYKEIETVFNQEKADLQEELDNLIEDYRKLSVEKKSFSKRLIKEINKIIALKDSVKVLKASNYNLISKYRKRIYVLERENRKLFARVDSLETINKTLVEEKTLVAEKLTIKDTEAQELEKRNKELKNYQKKLKAKVAVAGVVKSSPIQAFAMKEKRSGELGSTSRSSKTDAFKVVFKLLENKVAVRGNKKVYVQIVDKNNNVISPKGEAKLKDKSEIVFSDELTANYQNNEMSVLSLVPVNRRSMSSGAYKINAFVDGKYSGSTTVSLK